MENTSIRLAQPDDYASIVALNAANFFPNLAEAERRDGFLSAVFTIDQIAGMAEALGITVAVVDGKLTAFVCAFRNDFDHGSPVVAKMIESYDRLKLDGKLLRDYSSYAYGPVCIDRGSRRRGILRGLYDAQRRQLAGQFDIGVALIARSNQHSYDAHVKGLGMVDCGSFEVNGNPFATVAFRLPTSSSESHS